jgi:hypothetical protein
VSRFKLETLRGGRWRVDVETDDPAEYAQAVIEGSVEGVSMRHTVLAPGRPLPDPEPVNHVDEEIWIRRKD